LSRLALVVTIIVSFAAGFFSHALYERWQEPDYDPPRLATTAPNKELQSFAVRFVPRQSDLPQAVTPVISARDAEKIRELAGSQARVRGRVFRVGHSAKSNTYFVNFGPSRDALTAVIFASAVELFEKSKLPPKSFEGREVEVQGEIRIHPQYGLEVILESPGQIKLLD
jgi:hypothetical protein